GQSLALLTLRVGPQEDISVKGNRNRSKKQQESIQVWTYDQARRVLPYVGSIMRSLREHCLEARQYHLSGHRLAARPGRPDRTAILAHTEAVREADEADQRFHDAVDELHTLDAYC